MEHFTREELAKLCTRARALAEIEGTNPHWIDAYWGLANAANHLDAMIARSMDINMQESGLTSK